MRSISLQGSDDVCWLQRNDFDRPLRDEASSRRGIAGTNVSLSPTLPTQPPAMHPGQYFNQVCLLRSLMCIAAAAAAAAASDTAAAGSLPSAAGKEVRREIAIASDLVGCVIGRGGIKINEIRKVTTAAG